MQLPQATPYDNYQYSWWSRAAASKKTVDNLFNKFTTLKLTAYTLPNNSNKQTYAVADTRAIENFMLIKTILLNLQKASNPISVRLPNGTAIKSTHQGLLPLKMLPKQQERRTYY